MNLPLHFLSDVGLQDHSIVLLYGEMESGPGHAHVPSQYRRTPRPYQVTKVRFAFFSFDPSSPQIVDQS